MADRKNFDKRFLLALSTFCLTFAVIASLCPAFAQDTDSRLRRIENEIQTLSRAVFRGEQPPPGSLALGEGVNAVGSANTELRLQQIEIELRTLTGKVEEQSFENRQMQDTMQSMMVEMERRIAALESQLSKVGQDAVAPDMSGYVPEAHIQGGNIGVSGNTASPNTTNTIDATKAMANGQVAGMSNTSVTAPPQVEGQLGTLRQPADMPAPTNGEIVGYAPAEANDPTEAYEQAFSLLRERQYDTAGTAFHSFLERYPDHDLAANAKYWLGETYYVRNDFERAAREFAEAYQKYPKGPKGPDNLLKLGMSLAGLGKQKDACLTYTQLQKEYPQGALPILMRAEKEMESLGCSQF